MGGFAQPVAGILIELIKNVLNALIKGTDTGGVGELSNFIVGSFFIVPASIIYMRNKTRKSAVWGLLAGIVFMTISACFSNYYLVSALISEIHASGADYCFCTT